MELRDSDVIVKHGKLPSEKILTEYAARILSKDGPRVVRHIASRTTVNYVARQQDVDCVLKKDGVFNLSHYDSLLGMASDDVRFLLGDKNDDRDLKWQLLSKALGDDDNAEPFDTKHIQAYVKQAIDEIIDDIRDQCGDSVARKGFSFRRKKKTVHSRFSILWDFGFAVPFRIATEYFGISIPKKISWGLVILIWFARFAGFKPISKKYGVGLFATLLWSLPVNIHVFKNFEGRNWIMKRFARWGASAYSRHIDCNIAKPSSENPDALLNRLLKARKYFRNREDTDLTIAIRSILFELHGTMLILVGLGFNRSLKALYEKNISINRFAASLTAAEFGGQVQGTDIELKPLDTERLAELDAEQLLNEALRFDPVAGRLYRRVSKDIGLGSITLKKDEYVCLLTDATPFDESAFVCPHEFRNNRDLEKYLNFGPQGGPHACKGQAWARSILEAMFQGLASLPNVRLADPDAVLKKSALGLPFGLKMLLGRRDPSEQPDQQRLITIVVPVEENTEANLNAIDDGLDKLGNPAKSAVRDDGNTSIKQKFDATDIIHFASLCLVKGLDRNELSYLVFEMSADADAYQVIEAICDHAAPDLFPIFTLCGGLNAEKDLMPFLQGHHHKVSTNFFRFGELLGLGFQGTAGLDVKRIRFEHEVALYAKKVLDRFRSGHAPFGKMPLTYLSYVRLYFAKINGPLGGALDPGSALHFTDVKGAPWVEAREKSTLANYISLIGILPRTLLVVPVLLLAFNIYVYWGVLCAEECSTLLGRLQGFGSVLLLSFPAALLGTAFVAVILWARLRASENKNKPEDPDRDPEIVKEIMKRENQLPIQNHMIGIIYILPGLLRLWFTLPFALRLIKNGIVKGFSRSGFFDDIGTIHFARWIVLPKTRSLVFMSNYDGSFESYLEDFITKATKGLTGVWSNCVGFPKAQPILEGRRGWRPL